jgi:hypothetical protein
MRITRGANLIVVFVLGLIATASLATAQPGGSVLHRTLLEPNQKTPEVSTEELRRFLADGRTLILEGIKYVPAGDRTAVFLDARDPAEFAAGSVKGARNVPASLIAGKDTGEVKKARSSTARSP